MSASIDLSRAYLSRVHGDITAVYSWLNDERALFLIPHLRKGAPWFVVLESASYSWDDHDSQNVSNVVAKCLKACEVLGIEPTPTNCRRIAAIVIDGLPDLIRMPHKPEVEYHKAGFGHMELKADGATVHSEIIRVEKEGATYG